MTHKYRVEVIPLDPGDATRILDRIASDGWRLHTSFPVPAQTSALAHGKQALGLYCVFERANPAPCCEGEK